LKNFACVKRQNKDLQVWTRLDPSTVTLEEGFTRDVSQIGTLEPAIWKSGYRMLRTWNAPSRSCCVVIKGPDSRRRQERQPLTEYRLS
jgi:hypothetical protein